MEQRESIAKAEERLRSDAERIFGAAVERVLPETCIAEHCRREGRVLHLGPHQVDLGEVERVLLLGAGKASGAMALALEPLLEGASVEGLINVKYGHLAPVKRVRLVEAGHPVPDESGVAGTREILDLAKSAGERDLVVCLISGGGSALSPLPAPGLSLEDKQETTRVLLGCGATIHEINTLRKHLSGFKGGRLALAAAPARVFSLILSDVVGDDLDIIASGPTVPDAGTFADCLRIVAKFGIEQDLPGPVVERLRAGAAGEVAETPKPGDPAFERCRNLIIGSNSEALAAAEAKARELGYQTLVLSSLIQGETRVVASVHAAIGREMLLSGRPLSAPACLLSGGETTVTLTGPGKGGRNQEFALAAALEIEGQGPLLLFSGGTDGTDGPTDAAGALADSRTISRARELGLDPAAYLAANDSYNFFDPLGDLVKTGPTRTNVMDLRLVMTR